MRTSSARRGEEVAARSLEERLALRPRRHADGLDHLHAVGLDDGVKDADRPWAIVACATAIACSSDGDLPSVIAVPDGRGGAFRHPLDNPLITGSLAGQSFSRRFRSAKVVHRACDARRSGERSRLRTKSATSLRRRERKWARGFTWAICPTGSPRPSCARCSPRPVKLLTSRSCSIGTPVDRAASRSSSCRTTPRRLARSRR
jgi:hypothetical protein